MSVQAWTVEWRSEKKVTEEREQIPSPRDVIFMFDQIRGMCRSAARDCDCRNKPVEAANQIDNGARRDFLFSSIFLVFIDVKSAKMFS